MAGRPRKRGLAPPLPPAAPSSWGKSAHDSNCKCVRCRGFEVGNTLRPEKPNLRHGAKVALEAISDEASAIADAIRDVMPVYHPADEIAVRALSIVLVRIGRAEAALAAMDRDGTLPSGAVVEGATLERDLRSWLSVAERYLGALGMTPGSRVRLGLDIARARRFTVLDLHEEADEAA